MNTTSKLYSRVFSDTEYNPVEPEKIAIVKDWLDRNSFKTIADIGCGRGNYIERLEYDIDAVEPSNAKISKNIANKIIRSDILGIKDKWDAIYCMDVLEHIKPEEIDENIKHLSKVAPNALYGIANHTDIWNGVELHLIQKPCDWWMEKLLEYYSEATLAQYGERFFIIECSA